jgi:hypothetical protein
VAGKKKLEQRIRRLKSKVRARAAAEASSRRLVARLEADKRDLEHRVREAAEEAAAAQERARALAARQRRLEREMKSLRVRLPGRDAAPPPGAASFPPPPLGEGPRGLASAQRGAWRRHQYLQDRFEIHLQAGLPLADARRAANRDLTERHGEAAGYSDQELEAILM